MRPRQRPRAGALPPSARGAARLLAGLGAIGLGATLPALPAWASDPPHCSLLLSEHRSGRALLALPLPAGSGTPVQLAFVHSVLGTPVHDHYRFRPAADGQWRAHLVAEQFEGEGYGLPYAAAPGERLVREGTGWRLHLDRPVAPLVVLPLPSQRMRLLVPGHPTVLLGELTRHAVLFTLTGCPAAD